MVTRVRRSSHDLCRRLNIVIFFTKMFCLLRFTSKFVFRCLSIERTFEYKFVDFPIKNVSRIPKRNALQNANNRSSKNSFMYIFFYFILMINIVIVSLFAHTVFTFCIMSVVFSVTVLHKVSFSLNLHTNQLAVIPLHKH